MQDLEILIRYKCEKCDGSGAMMHKDTGKVIGNCSECGGNGKHQKWILASDVPGKWNAI